MSKLKIGLIACGERAKMYGRLIHHEIKNATLLSVSCEDNADAEYYRYELGIPQIHSRHDRLLELNELDAVLICAEPNQHAKYMLDTIEAGLNVFCDNPIALNLEDAERAKAAAAKKASQTAIVGYEHRLDVRFDKLKTMIEDGEIGEVVNIQINTSGPNKSSNNFETGGIFFERNLSTIDQLRWITGAELATANISSATATNAKISDVQSFVGQGVLTDGTLYQVSSAYADIDDHTLIVNGTQGQIWVSNQDTDIGIRKAGIRTLIQTHQLSKYEPMEAQLRKYINDLTEGNKFVLSLDDAIMATKVALGFTKSYLFDRKEDLTI